MDESAELEAAGNIIDCLDAASPRKGIIVFNVAPRGGRGLQRENGSPFGYFKYEETFIFGTVDGLVLPFLKYFGITDEVYVSQYEEVLSLALNESLITKEEAKRAKSTQFRSFNYLPFAAFLLIKNGTLPNKKEKVPELPSDYQNRIWKIDNFGNIKTSIIIENSKKNSVIETKWGKLNIYNSLKDAPPRQVCALVGSSGLREKRFLEIIARGLNCAQILSAKEGEKII
jgi:hypothetical protein